SARRAAKATRAKASASGIGFRRGRIDVVGIKTELVVDLALLGIAKNVVGLGDFFEPLLRLLVTGIYVRMVLARQLAEGLADFLHAGVFFHAQNAVIVFGLCWHFRQVSRLASHLASKNKTTDRHRFSRITKSAFIRVIRGEISFLFLRRANLPNHVYRFRIGLA